MNGAVKTFDSRTGIGYITPDSGGVDVFVHVAEVERAGFSGLAVGDRLSFNVQTDRALKRSFATKLSRL